MQTARLALGTLFWLLQGCSEVDNNGSHVITNTRSTGGSSGKTGIMDAGSRTGIVTGTASGGTSPINTTTSDSSGGAHVIEAAGGMIGSTDPLGMGGELTGDPPPSGGADAGGSNAGGSNAGGAAGSGDASAGGASTGGASMGGASTGGASTGGASTGTGGSTVRAQGGTVGASGSATTLPVAGAAGTSTQTTETLAQVMARFCALNDVSLCAPNCLAERRQEARCFPKCQELYRLLMACQVELPANRRVCVNGTVTSPNDCIGEDDAYWACVGPITTC